MDTKTINKMYEHVVKAMDRRRSKQTKKKTKELKHVHANE
jgi:hypothetical protein